MKSQEEEYHQMQSQLRTAQQQINMLTDITSTRSPSNSFSHPESRPTSFISVESSTSELDDVAEVDERRETPPGEPTSVTTLPETIRPSENGDARGTCNEICVAECLH